MGRINFWDDRTIARMTKLAEDGNSTGTIGAELGISSNSVIGKARRLDIALKGGRCRKSVPNTAEEAARAKKATPKPSGLDTRPKVPPIVPAQIRREAPAPVVNVHPVPEPVEAAPEPPVAFHAPVPVDGYDLLDLRARQRRYAITPDTARVHRFCGEAVEPGKSYCREHHALCCIAPAPKDARKHVACNFGGKRKLEAAE